MSPKVVLVVILCKFALKFCYHAPNHFIEAHEATVATEATVVKPESISEHYSQCPIRGRGL